MRRRQIENPQATAGVRPSGLVLPSGVAASQHTFNVAVKQILESGLGARGVPLDRNVTRREMDQRLAQLGIDVPGLQTQPPLNGVPADGIGVSVATAGGGHTLVSMEAFARSITSTRLFSYLQRPIDDPTRFDDLPGEVAQLLAAPLTELAEQRGADVRMLQGMVQRQAESFAYQITEVTAGIMGAVAGVRQGYYASANANRAVAGSVTTITARLDNFNDGTAGTASIEVKAQATVDRVDGLDAQYVIKLTAGGASAGFGLAATSPVGGTPNSAFIIQADKFAIVDSSYSGGLTNSPASQYIMFGVDGDGAYVGGNLKVQGKAQILGHHTYSGFDVGLIVNPTFAADYGIISYSDAGSGIAALSGFGSAGANGVVGNVGNSGFGVLALAVGGGGTAMRAVGSFGAVALDVIGPMQIDNATRVSNLFATSAAQLISGGHTWVLSDGITTGTGVATFNSLNKPGASNSNGWITATIDGTQVCWPVWLV